MRVLRLSRLISVLMLPFSSGLICCLWGHQLVESVGGESRWPAVAQLRSAVQASPLQRSLGPSSVTGTVLVRRATQISRPSWRGPGVWRYLLTRTKYSPAQWISMLRIPIGSPRQRTGGWLWSPGVQHGEAPDGASDRRQSVGVGRTRGRRTLWAGRAGPWRLGTAAITRSQRGDRNFRLYHRLPTTETADLRGRQGRPPLHVLDRYNYLRIYNLFEPWSYCEFPSRRTDAGVRYGSTMTARYLPALPDQDAPVQRSGLDSTNSGTV